MNGRSDLKNLPPFPSDYRASGILLHVTSLPSPYGIGDRGNDGAIRAVGAESVLLACIRLAQGMDRAFEAVGGGGARESADEIGIWESTPFDFLCGVREGMHRSTRKQRSLRHLA
jgi:hypothetical protein